MSRKEEAVITGYYRYTDIWFEWHKSLPEPEDRDIIKAILAHDALTHPEHPLHPGKKGVDMFLGTFQTGESRLLFSSKQVDYVRYWLHAMKLTKSLVPLPYSDCLLLASDLKTISPVTYLDGGSLRSAIKYIEKNNKRLKRGNTADSPLTQSRHIFERMRSIWREKKGTFCSVDFEAWERDHTLITEFGWSLIRFGGDGTTSEEQGHLLVEEAAKYRNSTYVVDNRERYNFGSSQTLKKKAFKIRIHEFFADLKQKQPVFLLFHDNSQDIKYLEQLEVDLTGKTYQLPHSMPEDGIYIVDTADMIAALLGTDSNNKKSLEQTCHLLQISKENLHNAGNDAHYTLLAMKNMAEGDPVDTQRDKRWPNQTKTGVQVELQPWQEDSDYSDEEGLFPFIPVQPEKNGEGDTAADA